MEILKLLVNIIAIGIGAYFLANTASDIQLGFGIVILLIGLNGVLSMRLTK